MGTSASLISTGVFFRKALFAPQPSTPSYSGPPPPPPPQGPIEDSTWRPSRVAVLTLSRVEPPAGQAGRRSGRARLNTPKVQAWMTAAIRLRMPTAAGEIGRAHV